jgi:hypothetical protein
MTIIDHRLPRFGYQATYFEPEDARVNLEDSGQLNGEQDIAQWQTWMHLAFPSKAVFVAQ